jgi:hypothetical protein
MVDRNWAALRIRDCDNPGRLLTALANPEREELRPNEEGIATHTS